jgi:hypothetical protein
MVGSVSQGKKESVKGRPPWEAFFKHPGRSLVGGISAQAEDPTAVKEGKEGSRCRSGDIGTGGNIREETVEQEQAGVSGMRGESEGDRKVCWTTSAV